MKLEEAADAVMPGDESCSVGPAMLASVLNVWRLTGALTDIFPLVALPGRSDACVRSCPASQPAADSPDLGGL